MVRRTGLYQEHKKDDKTECDLPSVASIIGYPGAIKMFRNPEKYDLFERKKSRSVNEYFDRLFFERYVGGYEGRMKRLFKWYNSLTKRTRDSISFSVLLIGFISTFCTVLGVSLGDIPCLSLSFRILLVVLVFVISFAVSYFAIGRIYKDKIELLVNNTPV